MTNVEKEILQSDKTMYYENQVRWVEFKVKSIPYRISVEGIFQTRLISAGSGFHHLGEWRTRTLYKQETDRYGGYYLTTSIGSNQVRIHRLVALCFIGEIEKGFEINHIDGNRENNNLINVEITTHSKNMINMAERRTEVSHRYNGKLSRDNVADVLKRIERGETNKEIALFYNMDRSSISRIRTGAWFNKKYTKK